MSPSKIKFFLLNFLLFTVSLNVFGQTTISGFVEDAHTGEKLINAGVISKTQNKGILTNNYGFYSFSVKNEITKLQISYIGYETKHISIRSEQDTLINISLKPDNTIDEVLITANKAKNRVKSSQMSTLEIPMKTIKILPVFLGETDVLKSLQLMPGVHSGSEGSSGLYVRGGGPDQNAILLDGVTVYNAYHLFGFFSIFNGNALKNVKLIKGGFPAQYGGRISSILDVRMKEGNTKEFKGEFSLGLISSKFTLEGPLKKDKTSFILTGRRTYIDILAKPFIKMADADTDAGYFFYDFTTKINHKFSDKSRLYFSTYTGKDKFYTKYTENEGDMIGKSENFLHWKNITGALRWNYMFNHKLFSNTTFTGSSFNFSTGQKNKESYENEFKEVEFSYNSGIKDISLKTDFNYIPNNDNYIKFGVSYTNHVFNPGVNIQEVKSNIDSLESVNLSFGNKNIHSDEFSAYLQDDIEWNDFIKTNIGIRYSAFYVNQKFYGTFEPRISFRFLINNNISLKTSYSRMAQYLHLLTNSTVGLPTDLWLPVTDKVKPQKSEQIAFGFFYNINIKFDFSAETYFKTMDNLIEYQEGASFYSAIGNWEDKIEAGKGRAYGFELLFKKKTGKTTGWIGYTLSRSERQFENLNFGNWFPYRYDRTHDFSIVVTHHFSNKFNIGANWVYGTGNATTLARSKFSSVFVNYLEGIIDNYSSLYLYNFEKRNSYRMPAYHRLDIAFNFEKQKKRGKRTLSFGIYNAYFRLNAYYLEYNDQENRMDKVSVFPAIPFIRYNFEF
ncbi:MAG: carboxypeptidase-like regulatory domain-containing protein [Bacteroidota bacterium]|nr:carboxypeptidase-like regulatory domain-containing protein [Bacteroidota bacterium]